VYAGLCERRGALIVRAHLHDSLLVDAEDERITEAESAVAQHGAAHLPVLVCPVGCD
jgi:hypothetical protein